MQGFLLVDKPTGITSHDVINRLRRISGQRRIGHAGTLDPFATGLLIVGIGSTTKKLAEMVGLDKEYEAIFVLGARSETDDPEGPITPTANTRIVSRVEIEKAMKKFIGEIDQMPPRYSAIKIKGKKMYELARKGKVIERKPRKVRVDLFKLISASDNNLRLKVRVKCGSGTYIRALARDLGEELKIGGYVEQLRRTKIGSYSIQQAAPLSQLTSDNLTQHLFG